MGITNIKYWEAEEIASRIANKAMEHVFAPIEQEIQDHLVSCYDSVTAAAGVLGRESEMISVGVLVEAGEIYFTFVPPDASRRDAHVSLKATGARLLLRPISSSWKVPDQGLTDEFFELEKKRIPFITQRSALESELRKQIENKSAKYVMKAWPEAAEFVASYFNTDVSTGKDVSMTQPLEQLLAKYIMPLLAAPQGV